MNAPDFTDMLTRSLAKTYNLLASMNNFPAKMIQGFAKVAPEEVRAMFIALFDESKDVVTRILEFKNQSSILLEKYGNGAGQHIALGFRIWRKQQQQLLSPSAASKTSKSPPKTGRPRNMNMQIKSVHRGSAPIVLGSE